MSKVEYAAAQKKPIEILGLKFPPVVVTLIRCAEDVPQGVAELDKPMFYCGMIKYVRLGNEFYVKEDEYSCRRGAAALGLADMPRDRWLASSI